MLWPMFPGIAGPTFSFQTVAHLCRGPPGVRQGGFLGRHPTHTYYAAEQKP